MYYGGIGVANHIINFLSIEIHQRESSGPIGKLIKF